MLSLLQIPSSPPGTRPPSRPSSACQYSTSHDGECTPWHLDVSPGDQIFTKVQQDQADLIIDYRVSYSVSFQVRSKFLIYRSSVQRHGPYWSRKEHRVSF